MGACLNALLSQRGLDGAPMVGDAIRVVVLANNCSDATAAIARRSGGLIDVVEAVLPAGGANAGAARRAAMDFAATRLPQSGPALICTTDADSRPRPDWVARLWKAIDGGAEAVAGAIDFDPLDGEPILFSEARRNESRYAALQAEIIARGDPEAHNPWPNHIWAWGANMAVTAAAYRRVGGLPPAPLAEDRAFVAQLRRHDVPVRHCLEARVWTSQRRVGRAAGGLASLVEDHAGADGAPCDAALEPAHMAWRRAAWRHRFRAAFAGKTPLTGLSSRLGITAGALVEALAAPTLGLGWSRIEAESPQLEAARLSPIDLPREIARAERLLRLINPREPADPVDRVRAASAGLWSAAEPPS